MARQDLYSPLEMTSNPNFAPNDVGDNYEEKGKSDPETFDYDDRDDDEDETTCGWLGWRPSCLQACNRSSCFLFFWCAFALFQSTTVNGLVYVITTTLERRFSLTSARSGAISSSFDFTVLALIVFVTYLTERLHKPLLIGGGAIIFALGSYVFTIPHFIAPSFNAGKFEDAEICKVNGTSDKCDDDMYGSQSGLYWYFIAAQVLHGIGACPLYTHGRTYIYENVRANLVPMYFAILQLTASLGVAVGYICGGLLLQLYTDINADTETLDITPESPLWIGNWWIGFLICGSFALLTSIPLMGFPKVLKGSNAVRNENEENIVPQRGSDYYATRGLKGLIRDFPRAMWNLIRNIPLMCVNFGVSTEFFVVACTTVFGPKFIETQYNLPAGTAALVAGAIVVPSSVVGVLVGGWVIKRFKLKYSGQAKFCVVSLLVSLLFLVAFLMYCPNVNFAGVNDQYDSQFANTTDVDMNLTNVCNVRCNCVDSFAPVCGTNDVMYYSACHAGCSSLETVNGTQHYIDCTCIPTTPPGTLGGGTAIPGRCGIDCNRLYIFFILICVVVVASSLVFVPSQTMMLSVVSPSQRTTAQGLQSLMFRAFGSVPGPIIFGTIIDNVCLIWEYDCDGAQTCWMYHNIQFAHATFIILVVCRTLSVLFFTIALFSYKPDKDEKAKDTNTP